VSAAATINSLPDMSCNNRANSLSYPCSTREVYRFFAATFTGVVMNRIIGMAITTSVFIGLPKNFQMFSMLHIALLMPS